MAQNSDPEHVDARQVGSTGHTPDENPKLNAGTRWTPIVLSYFLGGAACLLSLAAVVYKDGSALWAAIMLAVIGIIIGIPDERRGP